MANSTSYGVEGDDLRLLSHFVNSAEGSAAKLVEGWAQTFDLQCESTKQDDRILLAPDNTLCTVSYRVEEWSSRAFGRWIFFKLDSQISHVSTIVAAMGIAPEEGAPMFVMNLNLKPNLHAFNVVMGVRGGDISEKGRTAIAAFPTAETQSLIRKEAITGFLGHRLVFPFRQEPIDWSVSLMREFAEVWRASVAGYRTSEKARAYSRSYMSDSMALHSRSGTVFDELFGPNWVSQLFRDTIHKV